MVITNSQGSPVVVAMALKKLRAESLSKLLDNVGRLHLQTLVDDRALTKRGLTNKITDVMVVIPVLQDAHYKYMSELNDDALKERSKQEYIDAHDQMDLILDPAQEKLEALEVAENPAVVTPAPISKADKQEVAKERIKAAHKDTPERVKVIEELLKAPDINTGQLDRFHDMVAEVRAVAPQNIQPELYCQQCLAGGE